jgi:hypothetical protein
VLGLYTFVLEDFLPMARISLIHAWTVFYYLRLLVYVLIVSLYTVLVTNIICLAA